jgi:hypothetical protein
MGERILVGGISIEVRSDTGNSNRGGPYWGVLINFVIILTVDRYC